MIHAPELPVIVDPLIREAKQRTRRRRLLVVALLAGVSALAVGLVLTPQPSGHSYGVGWIPQGVQEIDVGTLNGSPPMALRVTDPSKVKQIIGSFDGLVTAQAYICQGSAVNSVTFTFRSADGHALATATSNPWGAWGCSPTYLTASTHAASLMDPPVRGHGDTFIGRVERLLGIKFPGSSIRG